MFNRVFISYASEDYSQAEELYSFLITNDFDPWLDKKSLMPGQRWDFEIKKALREAHFVILLLSANSVKKRGYFQKEFKLALKYWEEKLQDDIYLIPVKLDECEVPESLSGFQWIELDGEESFEKIKKSLKTQREKYTEDYQNRLDKKRTYETKRIEDEHLYENDDISFKIVCSSIEFVDKTNQSLNEIQSFIDGRRVDFLLSSRSSFLRSNQLLIKTQEESIDWYFSFTMSVNHLTGSFVSLIENIHSYTGGAHGMTGLVGHNFMLSPNITLDVKSLIDTRDMGRFLDFISDFCFSTLRNEFNEESNIVNETERAKQTKENLFWEDSLSPKWENFDNYVFSEKSLDVIFNQYEVSSYSFGIRIVSVPYNKILEQLEYRDLFVQYLKHLES